MRIRTLVAGCIVAASTFTSAGAGDISEQRASELQSALNRSMLGDVADPGIFSVTPADDRFEIIYDRSRLLQFVNPQILTVNGLEPLRLFASPLDGGLWKLEGRDSLDISGQANLPHGAATHFNYTLGSIDFSGIFDGSTGELLSGETSITDLHTTSITGPSKTVSQFDRAEGRFDSVTGADGRSMDITLAGTAFAIREHLTQPGMPPLVLRAENTAFSAGLRGLHVGEWRELIAFALTNLRNEKLDEAGSDRLKGLVRRALPLFASFDETVTANAFSVDLPQGTVTAGQFEYQVHLDGLTAASRAQFGLRASDISIGTLELPAGFTAFLPQAAEMQVAMPDLNFAAAIDRFLGFDLSRPERIDQKELNDAALAMFPGGRIKIELPLFNARSGVYDIEISGNLSTQVERSERISADFTILARDLDKTIAAVQQAAKSEPKLNQLSFGLMMAKGFASVDADGAQRWNVRVSENGVINVNGKDVSGAN